MSSKKNLNFQMDENEYKQIFDQANKADLSASSYCRLVMRDELQSARVLRRLIGKKA